MKQVILKIVGRDPLLFGDGRPFTNEVGALTAFTLGEPMPSTLAGFVRSATGFENGWTWDQHSAERARALQVHGPLLLRDDRVFVRAPADAVVLESGRDNKPMVWPLRPFRLGECEGTYPDTGLLPVGTARAEKPLAGYAWWPWQSLVDWLASPDCECSEAPEREPGMPVDERYHVAIDDAAGIALDKHLFMTQGLSFVGRKNPGGAFQVTQWSLLARVTGDDAIELRGMAPFGGEGRLAEIQTVGETTWPHPPVRLREAVASSRKVRMILVTPAVFRGGWKPGWLDERYEGSPPCAPAVTLRLTSAAIGRRVAASGWDILNKRPKPVRWLVGAGSVYFFEVIGGTPTSLTENAWLEPVSDGEQCQKDGYGLAVWGVW